MNYIEAIRPQYWIAKSGNVHRGLHVQLSSQDGMILGQTGWIDCTKPHHPRLARLEDVTNDKFEIYSHPAFRGNQEVDIGTHLLRVTLRTLSLNDYSKLLIIGTNSNASQFYERSLATLTDEGLISIHAIVGQSRSSTHISSDYLVTLGNNRRSYQGKEP